MGPPRLDDFGLSEKVVVEVRAQEQRQLELFIRLTAGGAAVVWIVLTALVYSHARHQAPWLGLVAAPLLALVGAVVGALPLAIVCGLGVLLLYPRHPKAKAVARYEAEAQPLHRCDVCVLARGDEGLKEGVSFCGRCDAWLCPDCRERYDLRAIAALKARVRRPG